MAERRDDDPVGGARRAGRRTPGVLEIGPLSARRPGAAGTGRGGISEARAYTPRGRTVRETGLDRPTDPDRPALRLVDGGPADPSAARGRRGSSGEPRRPAGASRLSTRDDQRRSRDSRYDRDADFDDRAAHDGLISTTGLISTIGTMILTTGRISCRPRGAERTRRRRSRRATYPAARRTARSAPTCRGRTRDRQGRADTATAAEPGARPSAADRRACPGTAGPGAYGHRCVRSGRPNACASEP